MGVVGGGGGSKQLLCLNPTTDMVVLLLGLCLLLGCDNITIDKFCMQYYNWQGLYVCMDFVFSP